MMASEKLRLLQLGFVFVVNTALLLLAIFTDVAFRDALILMVTFIIFWLVSEMNYLRKKVEELDVEDDGND